MTNPTKRHITAEMLKAGVEIRWSDGRIVHSKWVVIRELPDGTYEVEEPSIGSCWIFGLKNMDYEK